MPTGKTIKRVVPKTQIKRLIGLTGGFGSGKSTVLKIFKEKGVFTLDADQCVSEALKKRGLLEKIKKTFGESVFEKPGTLNKKALAKLAFSSQTKRKALERLIHPKVRTQFKQKLKTHRRDLAILDIPLLFESGWENKIDQTIVVWANQPTRLARLKKRGFSPADARRRMKAQIPLADKKKKADFLINNNGSFGATKKQTLKILNQIKSGINP